MTQRWFQSIMAPGGLSLPQYLSLLNRVRRRGPGWRERLRHPRSRPPCPERLGILGIMKNESHLIDEWLNWLDGGPAPDTVLDDNLKSVAMVFGAIEASRMNTVVDVEKMVAEVTMCQEG